MTDGRFCRVGVDGLQPSPKPTAKLEVGHGVNNFNGWSDYPQFGPVLADRVKRFGLLYGLCVCLSVNVTYCGYKHRSRTDFSMRLIL